MNGIVMGYMNIHSKSLRIIVMKELFMGYICIYVHTHLQLYTAC